MLTAKQHALLSFIAARLEETGVSPSFEEMKAALDLRSKSGVHRLVEALVERGFLRRLPNRARALEVLRLPGDVGARPAGGRTATVTDIAEARARAAARAAPAVRALPFAGRIAAGRPIEAVEDRETLEVPADLLGAGEHYALQVVGDSMVEAGILDGDFALIRKCEEARPGDIVVALIDDTEATLKYFHREKGMIRLDPANAAYQPQFYLPSRVKIQGRLAGLLRRY
ncbi:MAG: transcriptional repressor LexA [Thermaurantiacus tibetensis]|uniref:transcriptional repressor LexA n=1 Tax=Thermaurantiacus tibetensis TaxID=2759035 RepID=UPI00188FA881|nr:transcriptional repressor LexA [Thermaurantiacus tibetensis]